MTKLFAKPARIALGFTLLGALTLGGLGCGGGTSHPKDSGTDSSGKAGGSAGATGNAGSDGSAGTGGSTAGADGSAGTGGSTAGSDGGAGTGGGAGGATGNAGSDGSAGATAGSDGGAGADGAAGSTAGSDGGAGADGAAGTGAAGSDGGVADASDGGDAADVPCTNACTLGQKQCGGGGIQTCVNGPNNCTTWAAAASCGTHQACTGAVGAAACTCNVDPSCGSATATFCASASSQSTCGADTDGCFYVVSTTVCPTHQECKGNNPTGACDCSNPPAECNAGAGTKFCATSGTISTCTTDSSNSKNCLYAAAPVACAANQTCTGAPGAAACTCNADPNGCTVGNSTTPSDICGTGNTSVHCSLDGNNCPVSAVTQCNAHSTCDATTHVCACNTTACTVAGPVCSGGNVHTCATDGACLYDSGTTTTCTANETCGGAAGAAACSCNAAPAACTGGVAGTFCSANTLTTCVADAHACVTATSAACGGHQICGGSGTAQSCVCDPAVAPAGCTGSGSFCTNGTTQSLCQTDAQTGCPFSDPVNNSTCPTHQSCKSATLGQTCSCDNTCTAQQASGAGTFCVDAKHSQTCTVINTCDIAGGVTACAGIQTCQGADGMGACACPVVGVVAGTGCTTLNATLCAGDTVLTCQADTTGSACLQWVTTSDCTAAGHVCGTKSGAAACQCPQHTGTNVYADPVGGTSATTGLFATGVQSPADCRFDTLTDALAATSSGDTVIATTAAPPATFGAETFPLFIPAGVTVKGEVPSLPGNFTIAFNSGGATRAVDLGDGATIEGLTITQSGGNAAASAILMSGTGATVDTVDLNGPLAVGINVTGQGLINASTVNGFSTGVALGTASGVPTQLNNSTVETSVNGVGISSGTLSTTASVINGGSGSGVVVVSTGTLSATGLSVKGMTGNGIIASGSATVNVGGSSDIGPNTLAGLSLSAGTATLGAVTLHNNASGITQTGGVVNVGSGATSTVTLNTTGVTLSGGMMNVGTGTITANTGNGVTVTGGATLTSNTGAQYTNNGGDGINETSSTLTFNGANATPIVSSGNKGDGINMSAGGITASYLTLSGNGTGATKSGLEVTGTAASVALGAASDSAVSITGNHQYGVYLNAVGMGGHVTMSHGTISTSGVDGIYVDLNGGAAASAATLVLSNLTISSNGANGVHIQRAPANVSAVVFSMDNLTVASNGTSAANSSGIFFDGNTGAVAATLTNSHIQSNTGIGLRISNSGSGAMTETLQGNEIFSNTSSGITFEGKTNLSGFSANKVHGNLGDQITVASQTTGNAAYNFNNTDINPCDANQNQVYCYGTGTPSGTGKIGIRVTANNVTVNAQDMTWRAGPTTGNDFVAGTGGTFNISPACGTTTTCP